MVKNKPKKKSVLAEARAWATKRKLFGTQAFLRYVILRFAESLSQISDDFVFKGGNLLWVYIDTPRATTDLDLATLKTDSHTRVRELLRRACAHDHEINYSLIAFKEIEQVGKSGAAVTIAYTTDQGASNRFEVDIVYTRMKDYDDLWRIAWSGTDVNASKLGKLLKQKGVVGSLDARWINSELDHAWLAHCSKYKDLPKSLSVIFDDVNGWLAQILR